MSVVIFLNMADSKEKQIAAVTTFLSYAKEKFLTSFEIGKEIVSSAGIGDEEEIQRIIIKAKSNSQNDSKYVAEKIVNYLTDINDEEKMKFKRFLIRALKGIIILIFTYGFLSICNWHYNAGEWNGFSRVILGIMGVIAVFVILDNEKTTQD